MDEQRREKIRERYNAKCGYCGVHETDAGATLTIDHHRPLLMEARTMMRTLFIVVRDVTSIKGRTGTKSTYLFVLFDSQILPKIS